MPTPLRFPFVFGLVVALGISLLTSTVSLPPAPKTPTRVSLLAVGDILLGRRLGAQLAETGDYSLPFRSLESLLAAANISFGNLEGPFCPEPPYPSAGMVFRVRPEAVAGLVAAGFDVLSVANNHAGDCGEAGIRFTLEHLRQAGILPVGAGQGFVPAHAGTALVRGRVRFVFLAYSYAPRNDWAESLAPVVPGRDAEQMRRDVARARRYSDVVVVSLHDGAEYTRRVAPETEAFARAAIEAGAQVVVGHHPHVPQRVEAYRNGWIFYSLGNFVFEQTTPGTREGLLARLTFSGSELEQVEAIPVVIEAFSQPRLATAEEAKSILAAIGLTDPVLFARSSEPASRRAD